ncbi:MAG: substrate-binding periplasmic protein [Gemmatimonadaceae bacterium]
MYDARHAALAFVLAVAAAACNLPHDADATIDRVRGGTMRVGFVVDTPWVTDSAGGPGGIEPALVRALASDLGATVRWTRGQQSNLLQTLSKRELDLVVGGIAATSPWKQQLALTRPYYTDTVLVADSVGAPPAPTIERLTVAVRQDDPVAAEIRKKKGTPQPVADLATAKGLVAAPTWKLEQLGRMGNPRLQLAQTPHVLAAPAGENAWLVAIEQLLYAKRNQIPSLLRSSQK